MKRIKKLVCDLDGTVFDTYSRARKVLIKKFKKEIRIEDITPGNLLEEEIHWLRNICFKRVTLYKNLGVYEGAVEVLQFLKKKYKIIYVSARFLGAYQITVEELKGLKIFDGDLVFVDREKKALKIREINPEIVVEDEIKIIAPLIGTKIKIFLLKRPWNYKIDGVYYVDNWFEIKRILGG